MSERGRQPDGELRDVIAEERSRREGRTWLDTDARREQQKREGERAEDEALVLQVIREGNWEKLLIALRALGLPETRIRHVEQLWRRVVRR